jgi:hypothetical protein
MTSLLDLDREVLLPAYGGAAMSSGSGIRIAPNHSGVLRQLADLLDQISERESELNKLRKEYDALRKKL